MAAFVNIGNWTADQVAEWLRGIDDVILPYGHFFLNNDVNGKKLLMLTHSDLDMLNVTKLGHQELIMEAVDLLRGLHYGLGSENLQSISLHLGCKAQCLYNELSKNQDENNKNVQNTSGKAKGRLSVATLTAIADLISTLTHLVSWLDRAPFHTMYELTLQRNTVVKIGMELVTATQKEHSRHDCIASILKSCTLLSDICTELVCDSQDPLLVQPAWLELATLHKKQEEELGMHIQSSYNGVHVIGGIKDMSPADLCGKVEKGDEVIAVNYQIVVGWTLKNLVTTLKEKPKEVVLMLKKRPCHMTSQGGTTNNNRTRMHQNAIATLPKALLKRRSREGDKPRPSLQELGVMLADDYNARDGTDTDNEVFKSGSESPKLRLKVEPVKPRRATVSGGSPTLEHPSIDHPTLISLNSSDGTMSITSSVDQSIDLENFEGIDDDSFLQEQTPSTSDYSRQQFLTVEPPTYTRGDTGIKPYSHQTDIAGLGIRSQPLLTKIRRLSSDSDASVVKGEDASYSFTVVGGVIQRAVVDKASFQSDIESPALRRHLRVEKRKLDRRVSCKDLGQGDCEGWLYRKKKKGGSGLLSNKWHKRWCILKNDNLYCYKQQDDLHAEGVIHLPSFKISPDELATKGLTGTKKMFAFRVYNSGTGFYFASDRQEDMSKWMNKMGLASINYSDCNQLKVDFIQGHDIAGSDSGDSSRDQSPSRLSPSSSSLTPSPKTGNSRTVVEAEESQSSCKSPDDLSVMMRSIHSARLTVDGVDKNKRRTVATSINLSARDKVTPQDVGDDFRQLKHLQALQRTVKDKLDVVNEIDVLLSVDVTPEKLNSFYDHNRDLFPKQDRKNQLNNDSTV